MHQWITYYITGYALCFVFVMPGLTLIHELGHAVPQLLQNKRVVIRLGTHNKAWRLQLGRLYLRIAPFSLWHGLCSIHPRLPKGSLVSALLAGPLTSLGVALTLYTFTRSDLGPWFNFLLQFSAGYTLFQGLVTLIPFTYPACFRGYAGLPSDGLQVLKALRRKAR